MFSVCLVLMILLHFFEVSSSIELIVNAVCCPVQLIRLFNLSLLDEFLNDPYFSSAFLDKAFLNFIELLDGLNLRIRIALDYVFHLPWTSGSVMDPFIYVPFLQNICYHHNVLAGCLSLPWGIFYLHCRNTTYIPILALSPSIVDFTIGLQMIYKNNQLVPNLKNYCRW